MNNYQKQWERRSSIRTRPSKRIDFTQAGYFFPPDKQVALMLPEVIKLGDKIKQEILLHSCYKYLHDIINLEIKFIHSACNNIIFRKHVVAYSEDIKLNATTVIIDEYYHVYVAQDMILQLNSQFPQVQQLSYPKSDSYNAMIAIKGKLDSKYHELFEIIAVCIFETTLVRELVEFFNSPDVHPSIKHYVNDHMNDEAKHYGFFYDLLCWTWNEMPEDYKIAIGTYLGDFVKMYLNVESDKSFNLQLLSLFLKDEIKAKVVIEELYKDFEITIDIPIVKNVLNVFKKAQILDQSYVQESFIRNGLNVI